MQKKKKKQTRVNSRRKKETNNIFKKSKLKIIPLGGLHEVGKT